MQKPLKESQLRYNFMSNYRSLEYAYLSRAEPSKVTASVHSLSGKRLFSGLTGKDRTAPKPLMLTPSTGRKDRYSDQPEARHGR